jgi:hypothetical protein
MNATVKQIKPGSLSHRFLALNAELETLVLAKKTARPEPVNKARNN